MKPMFPGQAALTRHCGKVCIVVCDFAERLQLSEGE
jgi:hypothetical protein